MVYILVELHSNTYLCLCLDNWCLFTNNNCFLLCWFIRNKFPSTHRGFFPLHVPVLPAQIQFFWKFRAFPVLAMPVRFILPCEHPVTISPIFCVPRRPFPKPARCRACRPQNFSNSTYQIFNFQLFSYFLKFEKMKNKASLKKRIAHFSSLKKNKNKEKKSCETVFLR